MQDFPNKTAISQGFNDAVLEVSQTSEREAEQFTESLKGKLKMHGVAVPGTSNHDFAFEDNQGRGLKFSYALDTDSCSLMLLTKNGNQIQTATVDWAMRDVVERMIGFWLAKSGYTALKLDQGVVIGPEESAASYRARQPLPALDAKLD